MKDDYTLKVGLAQISPVWLNKAKTIEKIESKIKEGGEAGCDLIVFGEALLPGYPFWIAFTNGAEFESQIQKEIHAHYVQNAIDIEAGDLNSICSLAKQYSIAIYLGVIERPLDRGGHSIYCSLVYINQLGEIQSVHRKLQPTYEERLTWSQGDGHGLQVHPMKKFRLGGLNCWENWMPLARTALYGLGENVHIAVWPGSDRNTIDITKYIAKESRSFVISVSGILNVENIPYDIPHHELIRQHAPSVMANGGSCIAGPDGEWVVEPIVNKEGVFIYSLDYNRILEERQNFDPVGHYSRPDVTKLIVNRDRQSTIDIK